MDSLSSTLDHLRLRGTLRCRVEARAPWGLVARPGEVATFHGIVAGSCVLTVGQGTPPLRLSEGDVAIVCHGHAHAIRDSVRSVAAPLEGALEAAGASRVVRIGGTGASATILCGAFYSEARDAPPMFSLLPPVLRVRGHKTPGAWTLMELLARETQQDAQGSSALTARLSEALFILLLRSWSEQEEHGGESWMRGLSDRRIAAALAIFHRAPEKDHSLDSVARAVGMSRSALAARFRELVGEAPRQYLIRWRLYLASVLLRDTDLGIAEIAARVGYESEASLTKAFTQRMGTPPGTYRRRAA
jgi:AraC-like DNA-binding protein